MTTSAGGLTARRVHVRGVVQGVGFRPYVFRLARAHSLAGWVLNGDDGVRIHVEGRDQDVETFLSELAVHAPAAARISGVEVSAHQALSLDGFDIRVSTSNAAPTTRVSPDLAVCDECVAELFDPSNSRYKYPYITCTNCGPRFSIVHALPYDRAQTTMREWQLCARCAAEYSNPLDRRFHAQPVACPSCGPGYTLLSTNGTRVTAGASDIAIRRAAALLHDGRIVAIKGIGGYHLACDARNEQAVAALRARKFRKEKPFALMARDLGAARQTAIISAEAEASLVSVARPIVLCPARESLGGVAPDSSEYGLMLPYSPLHHLLFDAGAPNLLVLTSGNRSNEPIAYRDEDAVRELGPIADSVLAGGRPIARRVDDSVVRIGSSGAVVLRRSRGYAPGVVATLPSGPPLLAVGADLKNAVTLVIDGEAIMSQHIGDLEHFESLTAFRETIEDLLAMYCVDKADLVVAHDLHPQYRSTAIAQALPAQRVCAVQHHRAHVASVLAECGELDTPAIGVAFDGTGYGDDGTIWGGEIFAGSVRNGLDRVASLHSALLPGGDAAARHPAQAAAGFVAGIDAIPDLTAPPFNLPARYTSARALVAHGVRSFATTSVGRLFDAVAAIAGFTRAVSYEGQAAMWLEHLARGCPGAQPYAMPFDGAELDWRPSVRAAIAARQAGASPDEVALAFHLALAEGVAAAAGALAVRHRVRTVVLSGGVFQNALLAEEASGRLGARGLRVLMSSRVPPNDGGVSLGQAALVSVSQWRC